MISFFGLYNFMWISIADLPFVICLSNVDGYSTSVVGAGNSPSIDHIVTSMPQKGLPHHCQPCGLHDIRVVEIFFFHILDNLWDVVEINVSAFRNPTCNTHAIMIPYRGRISVYSGQGLWEIIHGMSDVRVHQVGVAENLRLFIICLEKREILDGHVVALVYVVQKNYRAIVDLLIACMLVLPLSAVFSL